MKELDLNIGDYRIRSSQPGEKNIQTDWQEERHNNAEYELHLILDGSCRFEADRRVYPLRGGDGVLLAPGVFHMADHADEHFLRLSLAFSFREGSGNFFEPKPCTVFRMGDPLRNICRSYVRELDEGAFGTAEMRRALLLQLYVEVGRELSGDNLRTPEDRENVPRSRTDIIDEFFEKHHTESVCQTDLAELLSISERQLARILREHYGMGFRQKLLSARMDRAEWLLRSTGMRISDICTAVGFSSEGDFFRRFRSCFGMTPRQYRMENHG